VRTDQFHLHPISLPNPSETQYPGSCWVRETDTGNAAASRCLSNPIRAQIWALIHGKRERDTNMNQVGRHTCTNENSGTPGKEVIDSVCCTTWNKTHGKSAECVWECVRRWGNPFSNLQWKNPTDYVSLCIKSQSTVFVYSRCPD